MSVIVRNLKNPHFQEKLETELWETNFENCSSDNTEYNTNDISWTYLRFKNCNLNLNVVKFKLFHSVKFLRGVYTLKINNEGYNDEILCYVNIHNCDKFLFDLQFVHLRSIIVMHDTNQINCTQSKFKQCILEKVDFQNADFSQSSFENTTILNSIVLNCNISGSTFTNCTINEKDAYYKTHFKKVDLSNSKFLGKLELYSVFFEKVNFSKSRIPMSCTIKSMQSYKCDFSDVKFGGQISQSIEYSIFDNPIVNVVNERTFLTFNNVLFTACEFHNINRIKFIDCEFTSCKFIDGGNNCEFEKCEFKTFFKNNRYYYTLLQSFSNTNFLETTFEYTEIKELIKCTLTKCKFEQHCRLSTMNLSGSIIENSSMKNINFKNIIVNENFKSTFNNIIFTNCSFLKIIRLNFNSCKFFMCEFLKNGKNCTFNKCNFNYSFDGSQAQYNKIKSFSSSKFVSTNFKCTDIINLTKCTIEKCEIDESCYAFNFSDSIIHLSNISINPDIENIVINFKGTTIKNESRIIFHNASQKITLQINNKSKVVEPLNGNVKFKNLNWANLTINADNVDEQTYNANFFNNIFYEPDNGELLNDFQKNVNQHIKNIKASDTLSRSILPLADTSDEDREEQYDSDATVTDNDEDEHEQQQKKRRISNLEEVRQTVYVQRAQRSNQNQNNLELDEFELPIHSENNANSHGFRF